MRNSIILLTETALGTATSSWLARMLMRMFGHLLDSVTVIFYLKHVMNRKLEQKNLMEEYKGPDSSAFTLIPEDVSMVRRF